jgi:tRNA threonylcarbamoyl adenosine modification protein (Sua5/YciO/YrdC/YwlC family)
MSSGSVGVIPTDTVYGLVARALDQVAVTRAYALKDRELKPAPVLAANLQQLELLGIKRRYLMAVKQYWPGPVSVILPHQRDYLSQGLKTQPFRIPNDPVLLDLLEKTGPILATSANLPAQPTATTIQQAKDYFKDQVDFYIDGGDLSANLPSTIIRIVDDYVEVIRQGALKIKVD